MTDQQAGQTGTDDGYLLSSLRTAYMDTRQRLEQLCAQAADRIEALTAQLAEWQASQHYRYIGRDGKTVLARDLEDRIEALTTQLVEDADVRKQIDHRLEELVGQVDALTAERDEYADQIGNLLPAVNREAVEQRSRAEAAEKELQEMQAHIDHADAYHKAMLAAEADNARLRDELKEQIHIRQNCHLMPCAAPGNDSCECERMYRRALNTGKETK